MIELILLPRNIFKISFSNIYLKFLENSSLIHLTSIATLI